MSLTTLSNHQLLNALQTLRGTENKTLVSILYHLIELEDRRLFVEEGYESLFDYCRRKLKYSEGSAYRRIAGARCLRENPEVRDLLLSGEVTLCSLATAAKSIERREVTVEAIAGKSKREVEALVAPRVEAKPKERVKPVVVAPAEKEEMPLFAGNEPLPCDRDLNARTEERRYEIRFSVDQKMYEEIEALKLEFSNILGKDLSVEAVLRQLIKQHKARRQRRVLRFNKNSRKIPVSVKREVYKRDGGQCTYRAPNGTRCSCRRFLQVDHIMPYALGGKTESSNLRLVCRAHNSLYAERVLGKALVKAKRTKTGLAATGETLCGVTFSTYP